MQNYRNLLPWLGLLASVAIAGLAYRPGLSGTFHFDDFANLPTLGAMGPIDNWPAFWRYVTSGHADPTGRPVSVLSFLIDARDWPADSYSFLRTNVLLHLGNGTLLALLLARLGLIIAGSSRARTRDPQWVLRAYGAGVLGATLWMLHPFFVSTTLYVVQREAMLAATFVLIGLLFWLKGRGNLQAGRAKSGLLLMAIGLGGCTVVATLSKANGALLPALALVVELVLLKRLDPMARQGTYRRAMLAMSVLPTIAIAVYLLAVGWSGLADGDLPNRPWTLGERLLTQPRAIAGYLGMLWFPRPFASGLFNDDMQVSSSLLSPGTTLPALLLVATLAAGAWRVRRKFPLVAVAILFYFTGHLVESTTIALELKFEHRNYLPAMLLFWAPAAWVCGLHTGERRSGAANRPRLRLMLAICMVLILAAMTHARTSLWGDARTQALLWAQLNHGSARAQAYAANFEIMHGRPDIARELLRRAREANPDDIQLALGLLSAECALGEVEEGTLQATLSAFAKTRQIGGLLTSWFAQALSTTTTAACPQLSIDFLEKLVDAAQQNPHLQSRPGSRQDLQYLRGHISLVRSAPGPALARFNLALSEQVRPGFALQQAALLGASGYPKHGLAHLDYFDSIKSKQFVPEPGMPRIHDWVLQKQGYWERQMDHLRAVLAADQVTAGPNVEADGSAR